MRGEFRMSYREVKCIIYCRVHYYDASQPCGDNISFLSAQFVKSTSKRKGRK
jgi:hypothetical protein